MTDYPYPCCRCGFCCLHQVCPIGIVTYGNQGRCPGLSFEGNIASCALAGTVPVGDGCCIKATAYKDGKEYDFAALPTEQKQICAQSQCK